VGAEVAGCQNEDRLAGLGWNDFGARNRSDFVNQCQRQWDRERLDLSASDLRLSLQACGQTIKELGAIECEEILALYGPGD
jgi:hypothetical protein